ncbi:hypothetical protein ACA910_011941 [Epithemia clementina (nom. ined.)]
MLCTTSTRHSVHDDPSMTPPNKLPDQAEDDNNINNNTIIASTTTRTTTTAVSNTSVNLPLSSSQDSTTTTTTTTADQDVTPCVPVSLPEKNDEETFPPPPPSLFNATTDLTTTTTLDEWSLLSLQQQQELLLQQNDVDDEYDVILLFPNHQVPIELHETMDGHAAFAGYVDTNEPYSTIRNVGDVLVSIDQIPLMAAPVTAPTMDSPTDPLLLSSSWSVSDIRALLRDKAATQPHAFCRFRSVLLPTTTTLGDVVMIPITTAGGGGQLPGERQRYLLEQELAMLHDEWHIKQQQMQDIQATMKVKQQELKRLKQLDLEWMERKSGELNYQI